MAELIDLTGKRFGKLTVISKNAVRRTKGGQRITTWLCQCDCGNTTIVDGQKLRRGHTTSCGCNVHENSSKKKDIVGQKFGRLTVVSYVPIYEREKKERQWLCRCECGNYIQANGTKLRHGHTRSCGCLLKDRIKEVCGKYVHTDKTMYMKYRGVYQRCYDESFKKYGNYGGRGIKMCSEWADKGSGFDAFYEWAMENGYRPDLTLDRIDVNGNYEPSNCRWITNQEQQNNKRTNVFLTYNGETHTMTEWARTLGVPFGKIRYHIRYKNRSLADFIEHYM